MCSVFDFLPSAVEAHPMPAFAQDASECRLANLDGLPPHFGTVQLQQIERRSMWKAATPRMSQHTTSPSMRQDLTLRWFTASTISGKRLPVVAAAGQQSTNSRVRG